jgi:O-antigen ligase
MRFVAAFAAFLLPLAMAPGVSFFHDVTPKAVVLLLACSVALLVTAWKPEGLRDLAHDRAGRWFLRLLCSSILLTLVSTALARHRELAWYGSNWRRLGAIEQVAILLLSGALAAASARSSEVRLWFFRALCLSGSLAAAYGVLQYFGLDPFLPTAAYHAGEGPFRIVRRPSTLGHSDYFGVFALLPVFIGFAVAQCDDKRWWRVWGRVAVAIGFAGMILSGSRAPLVGLAAGLCCLLFLVRPRVRTVAMVALLAGSSVLAFYASPAGARLRSRVHWIGEEPLGGARLLLWHDTLSLIWAHQVTGVGMENFVAEFPKVQSVALSRAYPDFYHESPHNVVLDAAAAQGIMGAILLIGFTLLALVVGYRRSGDSPLLSATCTSAIVAIMIAHQFTVFTIPGAALFYGMIGLLIGLNHRSYGRPAITNPIRYSGHAVALVAAVALCWIAWRVAASDHKLASARGEMDAHQYARAAQTYDAIAKTAPIGSADLYFSRQWATAAAQAPDALSKLRYSQLANIAAIRATRDPEQCANAFYNLAAFAAIRNDARATEIALRAAIAAAPNWFKPHWTLARLLLQTGRTDEARSEALRAVDLDAGKNTQVADTARQIGAVSQVR